MIESNSSYSGIIVLNVEKKLKSYGLKNCDYCINDWLFPSVLISPIMRCCDVPNLEL
jgi:hypothetical protein